MITVSDKYRSLIQRNSGAFRFVAEGTITLQDGSEIPFDESMLASNGVSFTDETSTANTFDIGAAIMSSCKLTLKNISGELSQYDFTHASVVLKVGIKALEEDYTEWLPIGTYVVDESNENKGSIALSCYNALYYLDRPYSESTLTYPATLLQIMLDACECCGVELITTSFENNNMVVPARPNDEALTFRDVFSWAAQLACRWVKCDELGRLVLGWYKSPEEQDHVIKSLFSLDVATDDVVVTGVKVVTEDDELLEGSEGYVLSVEGNDLVQEGNLSEAVAFLGSQLIGMRFRPFSAEHLSDPAIQAGDTVKIVGRKGTYYSVITSTSFSVGSYQQSSCEAKSPARNSAQRFSSSTKTYVALRKLVQNEKTARETAVENLAKALANSGGLYTTAKKQEDNSTIYYLHDKPTLAESATVMKLTAEAIGVSTDGGKTYPYGFTVTGEMITRVLQTEGVNADWINSGCLTVKNSAGVIIFQADITTGKVVINADSISIGGKAVATKEYAKALADKATNLNVILSNEYQGIPTDSDGNYTTFPECSTAIQVLYGQTDITAQCTLTATTSTGVTAALTGTTLKVTALAADTGWVDIKATYLGTMTATKRFNLSKVKDGSQGSNVKILNTEISMTQEEIATNSAMGYVRNWTVITLTDGLKAGDNVMLQVYNDTKGGEAYILATVNEVLSEYRINTTSAGLLDKGEQGKDGTTARTYILEPSVTTIKRGQDNVPVPDEIAFSAYYRDGTSASRTAYAGRFKIEKSTDGNTWSTVYISSANETSCRYELYTAIEDGNGNYLEDGNGNVIVAWYDEDAVMFRGTLYAAGGTTSALDMQTVPVVIDVAALTHEQIFNLLTNNGAWQGIFYLNGKMYVSGEYIAANSITADKLSVNDLYALAAKIGGWNINSQAIYKDIVDPNDANNVYRVYLQPPLATNLDSTWILSCQKSSDGGKTFSGNFILFSDGSVRYGGSDYYIQMNPSGDNPYTVVFGTVEKNESGSYNHVTYIRANGEMHTRKLIIASSPTYPHIVGDGTYLQMSPVDGTDWGIVAEYKDATQYLRPANSGQVGLGREAFKWGQIWSSNSTISTSDKREKNTITPLEDDRWTQFLLGLEVVSYRLNDGTSGRLHHGLIANDVEELMNRLGIDSSEFAGFVKWQRTEQEEEEEIVTDEKGKKRKRKRFKDIPICDKDGNPEYGYGLRYEEFLPMTIKAVQGLYQENEKLKEELKAMKKDIKELKRMMKEVG